MHRKATDKSQALLRDIMEELRGEAEHDGNGEWTEEETEALAGKLTRFTAAEPTLAESRVLLEQLKSVLHQQVDAVHTSGQVGNKQIRFAEELAWHEAASGSAWHRAYRLWLRQIQVLHPGFWLLTAVLMGIVWLLSGVMTSEDSQGPFPHSNLLLAVIPLVAGAGVSYGFRSIGTPMFELELSFPMNPAHWMLGRMSVILLYVMGWAMAATAISDTGPVSYSLWSLTVSWLLPLCFYCAGTVALMLRFGTGIGSSIMAVLWFSQVLLATRLGPLYISSDPGYMHWEMSKLAALLLGLMFAWDAGSQFRKLTQSHETKIRQWGEV